MQIPSIFISHGPPTIAIEEGPTALFLKRLGSEMARPNTILCISAHWETQAPAVSVSERPETIYDFYGFPDPLYEMKYSAAGAVDVAERAAGAMVAAGFTCDRVVEQGLDHGTWIPLALMYPDADIPVAQVSIQPDLGPAHHLELGKALAPLRDDGVLILGSGNITHNLPDALGHMRAGTSNPPTPDWAREFDEWVTARVAEGDVGALVDYRQRSPHAIKGAPSRRALSAVVRQYRRGSSAEGPPNPRRVYVRQPKSGCLRVRLNAESSIPLPLWCRPVANRG